MAKRPAQANISLSAAAVGSVVQIRSTAQSAQGAQSAAQMHLALFEMGLKNKVTRGENSGETLTHDFVVRQWQGPAALDNGKISLKELITLETPASGRMLGIAAFVQNAQGEVLQATACLMQ